MTKRILVTGSKGIVGQKLVEQLKKMGNSVFGVDLLHHAGEKGFVQNYKNGGIVNFKGTF